jgi:chromosome segregation ATPase
MLAGFGLNAAETEAWSLQKARARELSVEQTKLSTTLAQVETRAEQIARERRRVDAALQESAPAADETGLSEALEEAQRHGNLTADLTRARDELAELDREIQLSLQRLAGWSGSLAELETMPLPSLDTIDRFEQSQRDTDTQRDRWTERHAELSQRLSDLDRQIADLRQQHDLPTEEDLRRARQRRDEAVHRYPLRPRVGGGRNIKQSSRTARRGSR